MFQYMCLVGGFGEKEKVVIEKKFCNSLFHCDNINVFDNTRRWGPLRGPSSSSCGGLRPRPWHFFAIRAKKDLFMSVLDKILVIFGDQ